MEGARRVNEPECGCCKSCGWLRFCLMLTEQRCLWCRSVSWHQLPSGDRDLSVLTKNSFSWICPVLTEPKADPWEIQGDLCLALTHTYSGHRVVLPTRTALWVNKGEQVIMLLNCPVPTAFFKIGFDGISDLRRTQSEENCSTKNVLEAQVLTNVLWVLCLIKGTCTLGMSRSF